MNSSKHLGRDRTKLSLVNLFKDENAPPMGLVNIATVLKSLDVNSVLIDSTWDNIHKKVLKEKPDIVGISSMTAYFDRAIEFSKFIKENLDVPVIIGGVHISLLPQCLSAGKFDLGVIGEGEKTIVEVLKHYIEFGTFAKDLKGTVSKYQIGEKHPQIKDLDEIPKPDVSFLDERYFRKRWIAWNTCMGKEAVVLTTRGCPYNCVFCSTKRFWQTVRYHSAQYITDIILERIERYNINHIEINDDLFTINKKRLLELVKLWKEEGITDKVTFSCQPRANLFNEEMAKILKQLNVKSINFGFESGSERMLKWLKCETVTVQQNKDACKLGVKHRFNVMGSFIMGSPSETIQDMEKTKGLIEWMYRQGAFKLWHFVMTPFPATPIWEMAKERGVVNENMDWTRLRHENFDNPLLLDGKVDRNEFRALFLETQALHDKYWLGKTGLNYLKYDKSRLFRKAMENPSAVMRVVGNLIKKKVGG